MKFGLVASTAGWGDKIGAEQGLAAQSGIGWLREEFRWSAIEPSDDAWQWGTYDTVMSEAAKRGLSVLPMLLSSPAWAAPSWNTIPADPSEFAEFTAKVAARYGPQGAFWAAHPELPAKPVTHIELWNEPYLRFFSQTGVDAGRYARLVKAAAQAGRAANPAVRYLLAGEYNDENGSKWMRAMFTAVPDLAAYFDAVAVHPYTGGRSPSYYTPPYTDWQFRRVEQIHDDLVALGAADKHLWFTEIGWSTCPGGSAYECVTEQQQADYLRQMFDMTTTNYRDWVDAIFIYALRSWESSPTNKEDWFGIVGGDGTPKPAWPVLRSFAAR